MKNLQTFEEFLNEQEEMLNEDGSSIAMSLMLLMQSTATLALVMAKSGAFSGGGSDFSIKSWWEEYRRDKKVNKILDKLKNDPEITAFLQLPDRQQRGKWQKLIEPKLNKDEIEYLNSISRERVKRGKI
jgi:hypothetical protein